MTRKTFTYSQSITDLLFERYDIKAHQAPTYPPHLVFALIVEAHLGSRWTREIENWIHSVGGHIVWNATEEEDEKIPFAHYHAEVAGTDYSYTEELDD